MTYQGKTYITFLVAALMIVTLTACNDSADDFLVLKNSTEIRWTAYGIPHIRANNYIDLGEGLGYVMAKDRACNILEGVITSASQRARVFGAGSEDANINSDFAHLHLNTYSRATESFDSLPQRIQDMMEGYAKGFNFGLSKHDIKSQGCEHFSKPITPIDVYALNISISYWGFIGDFINKIGTADGVVTTTEAATRRNSSTQTRKSLGSNGWALGRDMAERGKSLLLSNTHLPHTLQFQWYEAHLTIPSELNVYGGFLPGFVTPVIGFNERFAWTHTWSDAIAGSFYVLTIPSEDEAVLSYEYEGQLRSLQRSNYQIQVKQADGSLASLSRTLFKSHYGPIVEFRDNKTAIAAKDAPSIAANIAEYWFSLAQAESVEQAVSLNEKGFRTGSQNILMVDDDGHTFYADMSTVPQFSDEAWSSIYTDPARFNDDAFGFVLDGSDDIFEWASMIPFEGTPKRYSTSYVQNANDSAWLANLDEPIESYSLQYGEVGHEQSARTRHSLALLETLKAKRNGVNLDDLASAMNDYSLFLANDVKENLVRRCRAYPSVNLLNNAIDISQACDVLDNWDGKASIDSKGTHIFREYAMNALVGRLRFGCDGNCWKVPFDPSDPVTTPSGLPEVTDSQTDLHLLALAQAVMAIESANLELEATLGSIQTLSKGRESIPIAGGYGNITGSFSTVSGSGPSEFSFTGLSPRGYEVKGGDGFILLLEFTEIGVRAKSRMLYSQSNATSSEHFFDQAKLVNDSEFKTVLFTESEIKSNDKVQLEVIKIP
ncbi:penicillin acylase family protein [Ningiella sp. W23]|uniref:penicillin acylase family protein n=1 Tax=Ningiella sp. W23 TaxID=3023715 RepID=UPI003757905B